MVGNFLASNQGDIVLAPATTKKSKKPIVIGVIMLIIVAIVICAAMVLATKSDSISTTNDIAKSYNTFLNYLLYGKDSDRAPTPGEVRELIQKYATESSDVVYAEALVSGNKEGPDNYFEKLNSKYNDFTQIYGQEEANSIIASYFIKILPTPKISESDILESFLANGYDATKEEIANNDSNSIDEIVRDYYSKKNSVDIAYLNIISEAFAKNCLNEKSGWIDASCEKSTQGNQSIYYDALITFERFRSDTQMSAMQQLFVLYAELNGDFIEEEPVSTGGSTYAK